MVRMKNAGSVADEAKSAVSMNMYRCCKKCARKRQQTTRYLPQEIIFQFLLHLPAQVLHQVMRHVCREWSLIISSQNNFARLHYRNVTGGVIIQSRLSPGSGFYLEMRRGYLEICKFEWGLDFHVMSSCNGLVVNSYWVRGSEPAVNYVTNPLTKQLTILPPFPYPWGDFTGCGLAFAEASMVYKVVETCGYEASSPQTQIGVVTLGVDKVWRHIDIKHLLPLEEERKFYVCPLVTGGYVHWVTGHCVLTLNVETETVCRFSPPPVQKLTGNFLPMGSNLSYIHVTDEHFSDVWEMDSVTGEWTMLFRIKMLPLNDGCEERYVVPVCWFAAREILLVLVPQVEQSSGITYNVKTGQVEVFEWEGGGRYYYFRAHVNSLAWWE